MTAKQAVLELLHKLPDDSSWDDIPQGSALRERVEESLAAADRGEVYSHEQVLEISRQWRKS